MYGIQYNQCLEALGNQEPAPVLHPPASVQSVVEEILHNRSVNFDYLSI
jgi:hypothetical protein